MRNLLIPLLVLVLLVALVGSQALYTVDVTQYAVITRFGEVQRVNTTPGLAVKTPFIDTVVRFDNRLLHIDVPAASMPDKESQFLEIDAFVRYRITDPRKFLEKLRNEFTADSRIGNIATSEIRAEIGVRVREEIIGGRPIAQPDGTITVEPRTTEAGIATREAMMTLVRQRTNRTVNSPENDYGVEIVDVRLGGAEFPSAIEASVFQRMRTEREVQAQRLRAEGEQQYLTITASVDRRVTVIKAEADRDAQTTRGVGEAEAIRLLAEALEQDPEFYAFRRSLEAYQKFLAKGTTVVLSAESDLFRFLQSPNPPED